MRSFRTLLPAAAAVLVTCIVVGNANASISGSAHDFGKYTWANNQICLPCHTTHNTIVKVNGVEVGGPLWNHTLSTATYTLYTDSGAPTKDANGKPITTGNVDTNSMLCLSCHDGTVAPDSFGGNTGGGFMTGGVLGTDLSDDHPIGDSAIWPTGASYMVDPSYRTTAGIMPLRSMADGRLAVGCTSCHEPHNRKNQSHLLWVNNSGSATTVDGRSVSGSVLCMNCHKK